MVAITARSSVFVFDDSTLLLVAMIGDCDSEYHYDRVKCEQGIVLISARVEW